MQLRRSPSGFGPGLAADPWGGRCHPAGSQSPSTLRSSLGRTDTGCRTRGGSKRGHDAPGEVKLSSLSFRPGVWAGPSGQRLGLGVVDGLEQGLIQPTLLSEAVWLAHNRTLSPCGLRAAWTWRWQLRRCDVECAAHRTHTVYAWALYTRLGWPRLSGSFHAGPWLRASPLLTHPSCGPCVGPMGLLV